MGDFGHSYANFSTDDFGFHVDNWGAGPFMFRIDGKRVFFEDSDMFGPFVVRKSDWNPNDRQPGEKSRFWDAYGMWRKAGRPLRGKGRIKVAVWKEPRKGQYRKDEATGLRRFVSDPDLDHLGYERIDPPAAHRRE